MIATLTLNPSLDLAVQIKKILPGKITRVKKIQKDPGGKGINISRIIHRLNGKTIAFGFSGGHIGATIENLLDKEGVKYDFAGVEESSRTNITIDGPHGQIKINEPGPAIKKKELSLLLKKISLLKNVQFFIISGSLPPGLPPNTYKRIIEIVQKKNIRVVLDTHGRALSEGIKAGPFMIKPNLQEAEDLFGTKLTSQGKVIRAAKKLLNKGIALVIISRGQKGIIAVTKKEIWQAVPPQIKSPPTQVGLGDAFIAGFVYCLTRESSTKDLPLKHQNFKNCDDAPLTFLSKGMEKALRFGVSSATASALQRGTALCQPADIKKLLPRIKVKRIKT